MELPEHEEKLLPGTQGNAVSAYFGRKTKARTKTMNNTPNTSNEGTQTSTEERTFTQDDVNRIVQERLAKEKGKGSEELDKRAAELDKRERRMNAVDELRKNDLPDYLVDALNMDTDEDFQKSMEAIMKMRKESKPEEPKVVARGDLIGRIGGLNNPTDPIRKAFGLK